MTTITIHENIKGLKKEFKTLAEAHRALGNARKFSPNFPQKEAINHIDYQDDKTVVYRKDGQFEIHAPMIDEETGAIFDLDFRPLETEELSEEILKKAEEAQKNIADFVDFKG